MKKTEKDMDMFLSLQGSALGSQMIDYLSRLQAFACDSRNWGEGEDKVHANKVASLIEEHLISNLFARNQLDGKQQYPFV